MLLAHYIQDTQGKLVQIWEEASASKPTEPSVTSVKTTLKVIRKKSITS
ncbi:hypothetical protein [Acinetobacter sp. ANC 4639]